MTYIVGLGNPGRERTNQRHNVGWMILDELIKAFGLPEAVQSSKYSGRVSDGVIDGEEVSLLYPDTYMNNSGTAVKKLVPKGEESNLILIYDDVDIPLGEYKLSFGRGDGGHNGVKSVIASLGTKDFIRLRIGIAGKTLFGGTARPVGARLPKYVLSDFKQRELAEVTAVSKEIQKVIQTILSEGLTKAMNIYN